MAIFGTIDAKALATDVSVTNGDATVTTTGDFTDRGTADFVQNGDILSLGGVQYTVISVTSATTLEIATPYAGSTGTVSAANAIRRTAPKEVANLLLNESKYPTGTQFIYVDNTEAELEENKIRGLKWPGWWTYRTYTDGDGNTRHKSECIAFVRETAANAGDFDNDNPAADIASAVAISVQPANQSTFTPAGAILTFTEGAGTTLVGEADETYTAVSVDSGSATFTVVRDVNGDIDSVTLVAAGSGYTIADTLTISGIDIGGESGAVATFTEGAGTTLVGEADETYTAVAVTGGTGTGATFTVVRDNTGAIDTVTLVDAGEGYTAADTLTIDGLLLGGASTTDDLTITVDTVTTDDLDITVDTVGTAAATFSVTAAATPSGSVTYQWQIQTAAATTKWTDITGATSDSLALTALVIGDTGKKYRVKVGSTAGAEEVISNSATLTVTAA